MSARVDSAWAEGHAIRRGDGEFYGAAGWVPEPEAAVWRDESVARDVALRLGLSPDTCEILPARLVNGRTEVLRPLAVGE